MEDGFVDLRKKSQTYMNSQKIELNSSDDYVLYLPAGIAHGFLVKSDRATLIYKTSTVYDSTCDDGVSWDSCGIEWSINDPIMSERDKSFLSLSEYMSPFK